MLAYSQLKQRMFSGGKRGEVCIFDVRQNALIQCLPVHTAAITCMAVSDVEGYLVTGSSEGEIKVRVCVSPNKVSCICVLTTSLIWHCYQRLLIPIKKIIKLMQQISGVAFFCK